MYYTVRIATTYLSGYWDKNSILLTHYVTNITMNCTRIGGESILSLRTSVSISSCTDAAIISPVIGQIVCKKGVAWLNINPTISYKTLEDSVQFTYYLSNLVSNIFYCPGLDNVIVIDISMATQSNQPPIILPDTYVN